MKKNYSKYAIAILWAGVPLQSAEIEQQSQLQATPTSVSWKDKLKDAAWKYRRIWGPAAFTSLLVGVGIRIRGSQRPPPSPDSGSTPSTSSSSSLASTQQWIPPHMPTSIEDQYRRLGITPPPSVLTAIPGTQSSMSSSSSPSSHSSSSLGHGKNRLQVGAQTVSLIVDGIVDSLLSTAVRDSVASSKSSSSSSSTAARVPFEIPSFPELVAFTDLATKSNGRGCREVCLVSDGEEGGAFQLTISYMEGRDTILDLKKAAILGLLAYTEDSDAILRLEKAAGSGLLTANLEKNTDQVTIVCFYGGREHILEDTAIVYRSLFLEGGLGEIRIKPVALQGFSN